MIKPTPIRTDRIRNIRQCTFGWVDHNFLHRGFLNQLTQNELLLYYFLITVADRNGVSFYDYGRICQFLKMELDDYIHARNRLCERSLIAVKNSVFQVLSLPESQTIKPKASTSPGHSSARDAQSLRKIFQGIGL